MGSIIVHYCFVCNYIIISKSIFDLLLYTCGGTLLYFVCSLLFFFYVGIMLYFIAIGSLSLFTSFIIKRKSGIYTI